MIKVDHQTVEAVTASMCMLVGLCIASSDGAMLHQQALEALRGSPTPPLALGVLMCLSGSSALMAAHINGAWWYSPIARALCQLVIGFSWAQLFWAGVASSAFTDASAFYLSFSCASLWAAYAAARDQATRQWIQGGA